MSPLSTLSLPPGYRVVPGLSDIEDLVAARNREVHPLQALRHDEVVAHMTRGDVAITVRAPTDEAAAIATATTMPRDWMGVANGALAVLVHPLHRGRGIGGALLREIERSLVASQMQRLVGEAYASDQATILWALVRGYQPAGESAWAVLDLARATIRTGASAIAEKVVPLQMLIDLPGADSRLREMYAVALQCTADIPSPIPARPQTYEQFVGELMIPEVLRDCSIVALQGDHVIGFTLCARRDNADATSTMTAVSPDWRSRGIATALKRASMSSARSRGIRRLWALNDGPNAPMRAVNRRLGYTELPTRVLLARNVQR